MARCASASGLPFLNVEYRLAPEYPYPIQVQDRRTALTWLHEHAAELGVDLARIAVMGDSSGGGLAAALAHFAKELRQPPIAKQILIYPRLDHRKTNPDPNLLPYAVWGYEDNISGCQALLGKNIGASDVPPSAAPARMTSAAGLPPIYIDTGELDIFKDENLEYAEKFTQSGISTEFHLHPDMPHGYDEITPNAAVTKRAGEDRLRAITSS